jgi:NAD(P)-dependent dehydrogenase (short-subunit alcohol dehydrogenase family)
MSGSADSLFDLTLDGPGRFSTRSVDVSDDTAVDDAMATDMSRPNQESETFNQKVISRVPQRRWGRPEDFEGVAVYLASEASRFQTASSIVIDGGYSMF